MSTRREILKQAAALTPDQQLLSRALLYKKKHPEWNYRKYVDDLLKRTSPDVLRDTLKGDTWSDNRLRYGWGELKNHFWRWGETADRDDYARALLKHDQALKAAETYRNNVDNMDKPWKWKMLPLPPSVKNLWGKAKDSRLLFDPDFKTSQLSLGGRLRLLKQHAGFMRGAKRTGTAALAAGALILPKLLSNKNVASTPPAPTMPATAENPFAERNWNGELV